jgi:hypothetical protein
MTWRQVIASKIDGAGGAVRGYPVPPNILTPGDAWPAWVSAEPSSYGGPLQTWHVMAILPHSAMADTIDAEDAWVTALMTALTTIGEVTIVEPVTVAATDLAIGDPLPALRLTLTTTGGVS